MARLAFPTLCVASQDPPCRTAQHTAQAPPPLLPPGLGWRARLDASIARTRQDRGSNYVQLATVDPAGHPRNRTVVFRGFVAGPAGKSALKFIAGSGLRMGL